MTHASGRNLAPDVVEGFGDEWQRFDQSKLTGDVYARAFDAYFRVFPWDRLPPNAEGFDLGCGSGRWAAGVAPRVGKLHCIDASAAALEVARRSLADHPNVAFHLASVDEIPLNDGSMDFAYCLGVLHHVPAPEEGLRAAAAKLKAGAPFLVYLYYALENQPRWYARLWKATDRVRRVVSRLPLRARYVASQVIAGAVYFPLARTGLLLEKLGVDVRSVPLSAYRRSSFYVMRTDALDRFGTRLEHRFTRSEIESMMQRAGLDSITFSDQSPYWCAVGIKR